MADSYLVKMKKRLEAAATEGGVRSLQLTVVVLTKFYYHFELIRKKKLGKSKYATQLSKV